MVTTITREDVRRLMDGGAPLIEVLPEREYADEHIPGALNIPLKKLTPESVSTFATDQPLIVYCWDYQ
jgi:phage shock protein E